MYQQVIAVEDWSRIDLVEVLAAMPAYSRIYLDDPSRGAFEILADEPPKEKKH